MFVPILLLQAWKKTTTQSWTCHIYQKNQQQLRENFIWEVCCSQFSWKQSKYLSGRSLVGSLTQSGNGSKIMKLIYMHTLWLELLQENYFGHAPTSGSTILVCIDYARGIISGGDFLFASVGNILEYKHGDVLIYNPTCYHGTTEFKLHENNEASGHIFFAFFMKKATLHAAFLSKALCVRVGVQPLICCGANDIN